VSKQRIGEEISDVLLYLLQVADHKQVDFGQAVNDKLVRNAQKYLARRVVAVVEPVETSSSDTHILLDYENVQPTEAELRAMVREATRVWVFHGPHQKQVEQRFASFGTDMTTVPISKTGKKRAGLPPVFLHGLHRLAQPAGEVCRRGQRQGLRADAGAREGAGVCGAPAWPCAFG